VALRSLARRLPTIARTTGAVLLTILIIFAAFRVTAPFLISSGLVRSGIEDALSKWTGYRADIEGTPTLDFWPTPRVTLNEVTIRQPAAGGKILGHIDSLSADFSLLAALRGRADFHEFHFLRPVLYLRRDEAGLIDWTNEGLLADAISGVQRSSGSGGAINPDRDARIGGITVEDGTLVVSDDRSGAQYRFDGINADVTWPRLSAPMGAVLIGRVNGQDVKLDFFSPQPLLLFAGKNVEATTSFTSMLITGSFQGATSISDWSALSGNLKLAVPDVPAFLLWSGERLPSAAALQSISLDGKVSTGARGLRFNGLSFKINDAAGAGIMDVGYSDAGKPKISGTLAFDQMNLTPFLAAFSLRLAADTAMNTLLYGNPLQRLDVDVRLSAKKAALGPFQFDDIGASLLVAGDKAKFDIGDSSFEGGALTAHLEVTERDFDAGGKLQISIHDADFAGLINRLNVLGPLPLATGSLDVAVGTTKPIWAASLNDLSGKLHFTAGPGSFRQLNISTFRELAKEKPFFRLSDVSDTAFDFEKLDLDMTFAKGSADVNGAAITGRNETVKLTGVVPFRSNGLALSGTLEATDPTNAAELPQVPFFIGGPWPDPVISPVNTLLQKPAGQ
jgi:AsmA protein